MGCCQSRPKGGPSKATAAEMARQSEHRKANEAQVKAQTEAAGRETKNPALETSAGNSRPAVKKLNTKSSKADITGADWDAEEARQAARSFRLFEVFYCNGSRWEFNNKIIKKEGQMDHEGWHFNGRVVWKVGSSLLDGWDWDGEQLTKHVASRDDSKIRPMKATLKQMLTHWKVPHEED